MIRDLATIKSLDDIKLFYFKYKDSPEFSFIGVGLIVLISFFVLWKVVFPQAHDWFSLQTDVNATKARIAQLKTNQNVLATMSSTDLSKNYNLVTTALPFKKDYAGMIQAIDQATFTSEMKRQDYSLEVGNLSTKSAQLAPETTITVKVSLSGDSAKLQKFLTTLSQELPLSEVVSVTYDNNTANVEVNFFYKFLPESLTIPYTDPIRVLSPTNQELLKTLSAWKDNQKSLTAPDFVPNVPATASGQ